MVCRHHLVWLCALLPGACFYDWDDAGGVGSGGAGGSGGASGGAGGTTEGGAAGEGGETSTGGAGGAPSPCFACADDCCVQGAEICVFEYPDDGSPPAAACLSQDTTGCTTGCEACPYPTDAGLSCTQCCDGASSEELTYLCGSGAPDGC